MRFWLLGCMAFSALLSLSSRASAQSIEITRQNRTVEVNVTETVRVDPDIAKVTVGCLSYGETHDQAYQANLKIADKVINALLNAGISKDRIASDALELSENPFDVSDKRPPNERKLRQYKAHQSWEIRVAASEAQKLIDLAVQAGANGVEGVAWDVADEESLEAKARAAAMERARKTAEELAKSAGAKLGELVFASNSQNAIFMVGGVAQTVSTASVQVRNATPAFTLKLFPEKVEKRAWVRAAFAIE